MCKVIGRLCLTTYKYYILIYISKRDAKYQRIVTYFLYQKTVSEKGLKL